MANRICFLSAVLASSALAQQIGKNTPEIHPLLPTWQCTVKGGCVQKNTSVVLDADYRWTHTVTGYDSCKANGLNSTLCPDAKTCAANCALEGVDYASNGILTNGSELTLNLFVNKTNGPSRSSPRVYLLENSTTYSTFSVLNREITFDVDASKLPCGSTGALYLSEMSASGGRSDLNPAGATYGTGYCDAQCPSSTFINGEANIQKFGACCSSMELWDANKATTVFTAHPCNVTGLYKCSGAFCGKPDRYSSVCDKDGCDYNPYRLGSLSYYQPNATVDTNRKFTVVTQFLTTSGNDTGDLREIRRLYVQNGKVIENAQIQVQGIDRGNSITDEFCGQEKKVFGFVNAFRSQGGMKAMGDALQRGMVLTMAVWDDAGGSMKCLADAGHQPGRSVTIPPGSESPPPDNCSPCKAGEGKPEDLLAKFPWTSVKYSNIKTGEIGSTFNVK